MFLVINIVAEVKLIGSRLLFDLLSTNGKEGSAQHVHICMAEVLTCEKKQYIYVYVHICIKDFALITVHSRQNFSEKYLLLDFMSRCLVLNNCELMVSH